MISDAKRKLEEINFSEVVQRHLKRQPFTNFITREQRRDLLRAALLPIADERFSWAYSFREKFEIVFAQPLELPSTSTTTTSHGNTQP